jgi:hypothetical protein
MTVDLDKLEGNSRNWLSQRAQSQGTTPDLEAFKLLDSAIRERMKREELFRGADRARVRVPGKPLTADEIEEAINWGRD